MSESKEWMIGMILLMVLLFGLGFCIGSLIDECIKVDNLAKVLYKDTNEYLQHRQDNFYDLLKLIKEKDKINDK